MNENKSERQYAYLPEDLLAKILDNVPSSVEKMNKMFDIQDEPIKNGIDELRSLKMTRKLSTAEYSPSLVAVDGSCVLERLTGTDLLLALAVGVEGLTEDKSKAWGLGGNQYHQWQTVLSHNEANARLGQGVMFLMELSVLALSQHDIRIMDGTHFTPILKINSMLSAREENTSDKEYADALRDFLQSTYKKIIPDIPDIIRAAFNDEKIIAIAKYSSSRDIINAYLNKLNIKVDDKTFFSLSLDEDEYLIPVSVGQSSEERNAIWNDLHIGCNLEIPEQSQLINDFKKAINPIKTVDEFTHKSKKSELYFTYYKPYQDGPAYRIELKMALANDQSRMEKYLLSIKKQIVFPEIREPYPQYLVDLIAKSISSGLYAMQESIRLSPDLKIDKGKFHLLFPYRT